MPDVRMPDVRITEFTDAGCPWAFSAEPFRLRLDWLYGEHLEWPTRMVGLSESPQDYLDKGFTTEKQASAFMTIAKDHGMRSTPRCARGWRPPCPPAAPWWPPACTPPTASARC
ncbi:MAG: hypothetical protein H0U25_03085 [Thermoleophilaceae bacterium]|nr:hypothetical protein [Thermoleophilaceae bacterium]